jgi:pyruvate dehydrogenase E1 component alpha subunit
MYLIRRFDEVCEELDSLGELQCPYSAARGAEAISVGVCSALGPQDIVFPGLHGIGELLAMGTEARAIMAELFGKASGLNRGKAGRLHLIDRTHNVMGISGVIAASVPLAAGHALAAKYQHGEGTTICFVGDRATNQGVFHETLNVVGLWQLPLMIVAINNAPPDALMPLSGHTAADSLAALARVHGIESMAIDAIDVLPVRSVTSGILSRIRRESIPFLLECRCYPLDELSRGELELLRKEWQSSGTDHGFAAFRARLLAERGRRPPDSWQRADPLVALETRLLAEAADARALASIRADVNAVVAEATQHARESAPPPVELAAAAVFAGD